jgi:hypothetical protein
MIIWIIVVGLKFKPMLVGFKLNKGTNDLGCDHNQMSQCPYQTTKKLSIFANIFMWCHFNVMLIKEICAKQCISMLENSKNIFNLINWVLVLINDFWTLTPQNQFYETLS